MSKFRQCVLGFLVLVVVASGVLSIRAAGEQNARAILKERRAAVERVLVEACTDKVVKPSACKKIRTRVLEAFDGKAQRDANN